jgi:hypothetical protein
MILSHGNLRIGLKKIKDGEHNKIVKIIINDPHILFVRIGLIYFLLVSDTFDVIF